jgi:hypothetical protein
MENNNLEYKIREQFLKEPVESYKVLTFGELKPGEQYIGLPIPGDNEGHGGFIGSYYIFEKTEERLDNSELFYDNAKRLIDGVLTHNPDFMAIIKVK